MVQHLAQYFSIVVIWEPTGNESMGAWDTEKSWLKDELMTTAASSSSDIIRRQFFDETHQQKFSWLSSIYNLAKSN